MSSIDNTREGIWGPNVPFSPAKTPFFYGWIILLAGTLGVVASIPGQTMGIGLFTDPLLSELSLTRVQWSVAYGLGTALSGLTLPFAGRLLDRLGARRLAVISVLGLGLALFYMSRSNVFAMTLARQPLDFAWAGWAFAVITLGFYFMRLFGQGLLTMSSNAMIGKWFDRKRGLAFGVGAIVTSAGFASAPLFIDAALRKFGWRDTWVLMGICLLIPIALFVWLVYRDNPEECGLQMDGGPAPEILRSKHPDTIISREYTRAEALRTVPFWAFNLYFGWQSLYSTAYTFHIESIGAEFGFTRTEIISLFVPAALLGILTNLVGGWLSDRTRVKYMLMIGALAQCSMAAGLLFESPVREFLLVLGLGISGALFGLLHGVVWPRFYGRKHLGAISGASLSILVFASAAGPYVFAQIQQWTSAYRPIIFFSALLPIGIALLAVKADNPQRKA